LYDKDTGNWDKLVMWGILDRPDIPIHVFRTTLQKAELVCWTVTIMPATEFQTCHNR